MSFSLTGNKVRLRAVEPSDLELIYLWENDTQVWHVSNTLTPFSRYAVQQFIETAHLDIFQNKQLRLMIDSLQPSKTVGTIDLFDFDPHNRRAGVGILIGDNANRRKGYASDSLRLLINYGFEVLELHQLYCNIGDYNTDSLQLFQKEGFVITGCKTDWQRINGKWHNEYTLQRINK